MSRAPQVQTRGLPGPLPEGERILWQGGPRWWPLAQRAFHVRTVAVYCATLLVLRGAFTLLRGQSWPDALLAVLWCLPLALAAVGIFSFLAWLYARATLFTVTSRRVVMRYGVALPMSLNLPHRMIASAALKTHADGSGDIALALTGRDRIAFIHLWPFARPWRVARPEPLLRAIPDAAKVAGILAGALTETLPAQPAPLQPAVTAEPVAEAAEQGTDTERRLPEAAAA